MISHAKRNSTHGFTLVELLVVIAIIAILLTISYPALTTALRHARITKCCSNLRNISSALITFSGDNNGSFPLSGTAIPWGSTDPGGSLPGGSGQNGWCQQIGSYLGVTQDPTTANSAATIFQCPDWSTIPANQYYSYYSGARAAYAQNGGVYAAVNVAAIRNPSAYILAGDISFNTFGNTDCDKDNYGQDPSFGTTSNSPTTYLTSPIHGGTTNIAFADGHVENVRTYDSTRMTTVYAGTGYNYLKTFP